MMTLHRAIELAQENGLIENWADHYAEPGYTDPDKSILFANWNERRNRERQPDGTYAYTTVDKSPARLAELAERGGYAIEWSDEWATCEDCGGAIRTSADSYGWQASFYMGECSIVCADCVRQDPAEYLDHLRGNDDAADTMGIKWAEFGYVGPINDHSYQHGWHPGQNDSPQVIGASLRDKGITDYLFVLDDVGQFDVSFSVLVHEDEIGLLDGAEPKSELPYDPGTEMSKVLQGQHSDVYHMTTREVSAEDFISGDWLMKEGK